MSSTQEIERLGLELDGPPRALDTKRGEVDAEFPEVVPGWQVVSFRPDDLDAAAELS